MINLPLFNEANIPLPFTEDFYLSVDEIFLGIVMIIGAILVFLIGLAFVSKMARDKVPHAHPETGIGGSVINPIEGVKSARFVEEGKGGAIQIELNEGAPRFHIFLYQIGLKRNKAICIYRRRLLVNPKPGDVRHYAVIKDKKVNAFTIAEDPEKGHLHVSLGGLIFAPILMAIFGGLATFIASWGLFFAFEDYADITGQEYIYGIRAPFESTDTWTILFAGMILTALLTFVIIFSAHHEGRRKN